MQRILKFHYVDENKRKKNLKQNIFVCSQKSRLATSWLHEFTSRKVIKQAEQAFWVAKRPTKRGRLVSLAVFSLAFHVSLRSSCFHFISAKQRLEKVRDCSKQVQRCKDLRGVVRTLHISHLAKRKRKQVCVDVAGRNSRVEVVGAGAGKGCGCR